MPSLPVATAIPTVPAPGVRIGDPEGGTPRIQPAPLPQSRIIVHTAHMSLVIDDVASNVDSIGSMAKNLGGWVVSSEATSRHSGAIAIRVPAGLLEEALRRLEALAIEVESRVVTSEDFTDEYLDTKSRLNSMRATEERILSFLALADEVEDALMVQEELAELQIRIEQMEGRLNFLDQVSAYSLIGVNLKLSPMAMDVDAGPDLSLRVSQMARFRASFVAPPEIEDFSFVWNFGDGTTISGQGSASTPNGRRVTATVNHTYADDRDSPYIVTVNLEGTGKGGIAQGSDSLLVSVSEVPTIEVFAGDNRTVEEGATASYSASFTRPEELWDYQYRWDFGDGSTTVVSDLEEGATLVEIPHSFRDHRPTAYRVEFTVSAMSDAGRVSSSDSFDVVVAEVEGLVVEGWNISENAKSAFRALSSVARVVVLTLIWVGVFSPVILVVVGMAYLMSRGRSRFKSFLATRSRGAPSTATKGEDQERKEE